MTKGASASFVVLMDVNMRILLLALALIWVPQSYAQKGLFLTADEYYAQAFEGVYSAEMLWLNKDLLKQAELILGHRFRGMRTRYQAQKVEGTGRTAWIFEEIGKTHPITIGVVVVSVEGKADHIEQVRILEFRESRGGEVRYDTFTDQFIAVGIKDSDSDEYKLDQSIDGITGATMSVRAVKKVARLALYFHAQTPFSTPEGAAL